MWSLFIFFPGERGQKTASRHKTNIIKRPLFGNSHQLESYNLFFIIYIFSEPSVSSTTKQSQNYYVGVYNYPSVSLQVKKVWSCVSLFFSMILLHSQHFPKSYILLRTVGHMTLKIKESAQYFEELKKKEIFLPISSLLFALSYLGKSNLSLGLNQKIYPFNFQKFLEGLFKCRLLNW